MERKVWSREWCGVKEGRNRIVVFRVGDILGLFMVGFF